MVAPCHDCGIHTIPIGNRGLPRGWEDYMVRDEIWQAAGMGEGFLCIGCLEKRLGRELAAGDFTPWPVNNPNPRDTPRLADRKRR